MVTCANIYIFSGRVGRVHRDVNFIFNFPFFVQNLQGLNEGEVPKMYARRETDVVRRRSRNVTTEEE